MTRPLAGIRVLDFSTLLPGPLATLLLREAGARVTKVERPGRGDEMRSYQPAFGSASVNFALLNRGKRSVAIDLKTPAGRDAVEALIVESDVLVEQFRPGVMERLGLDYESAAELNPRLVYCSITGYGRHGPRAGVAAHDLNYVAETGLLDLVADADGGRALPPALIADIGGGAYPAVMNILLALRQVERTGRGVHIDVAMAENVFTFMYWALGNAAVAHEWPRPGQELLTGGSPRYQLYRTADDRFVAAAPLEDHFWEKFCDLVGIEGGLRDSDRDPEATKRAVEERIRARPAAWWSERFAGADVCATVVRSVREALEDEHFSARGVFGERVTDGAGRSIPALPLPLSSGLRERDESLPYPPLQDHGPTEEEVRA